MGNQSHTIQVEVVYAGERVQESIPLMVKEGTTVLEAIGQSQILVRFPEIGAVEGRVGIFGKTVALDTVLHAGDRVEIYRYLRQDPKEARRARAKSAKKSQSAHKFFSRRTILSPLKKIETRFSTIGSPVPGFK